VEFSSLCPSCFSVATCELQKWRGGREEKKAAAVWASLLANSAISHARTYARLATFSIYEGWQ
jgi:hypothetical protein